MALTKVLIAVKTYPTLPSKYDELVCTAGFKEDGSWVRIYPVPFRKLDYEKRYSKYDWVEIDLEKYNSDFRPESFKPRSLESDFKIISNLPSDDHWRQRKEVVLKNVKTNLTQLIKEAQAKEIGTSLAVFKPKEVFDFIIEPVERDWDKKKLDQLKANANQLKLFQNSENPFEVVQKLPYKFSYSFRDEEGRESTLMIEDWEIGALYWNSLHRHDGDEMRACADVKARYFDDFAKTKDLYLFLGTTREFHFIAHNPFIIIGTFHPKKIEQTSLF